MASDMCTLTQHKRSGVHSSLSEEELKEGCRVFVHFGEMYCRDWCHKKTERPMAVKRLDETPRDREDSGKKDRVTRSQTQRKPRGQYREMREKATQMNLD